MFFFINKTLKRRKPGKKKFLQPELLIFIAQGLLFQSLQKVVHEHDSCCKIFKAAKKRI